MAYSIDATSHDCYPDSSVLVNKLGIRNQQQLDETELFLVGVQTLQFEAKPLEGALDFNYYKQIHKLLFEALYDWAGTVRTINMSKQHTQFCECQSIDELGILMFARIAKMHYLQGLPRDEFITEIVDFYANLNYLHPFREGNGRCQRLYIRQLALQAGYSLDFAKIDSDRMMIATIHAASGVRDTLLQVFDEMISEL
ncbi:Fic family protein [Bengtsoniella intestinalis]|uniref:Fic/DOC family protein n=1 Tax=Bengtsoniella intestinalis TaxID=3073143 RepID=UPI00391F3E56